LLLPHGFCCAAQRNSSAVEAEAVVSFQGLYRKGQRDLSPVLPSDIRLSSAHRPCTEMQVSLKLFVRNWLL